MLAFLGQAFLIVLIIILAPFWLAIGVTVAREGRLVDGALLMSAGVAVAFFGQVLCGGLRVRPITRWLWAGFMALPWVVFLVWLLAHL